MGALFGIGLRETKRKTAVFFWCHKERCQIPEPSFQRRVRAPHRVGRDVLSGSCFLAHAPLAMATPRNRVQATEAAYLEGTSFLGAMYRFCLQGVCSTWRLFNFISRKAQFGWPRFSRVWMGNCRPVGVKKGCARGSGGSAALGPCCRHGVLERKFGWVACAAQWDLPNETLSKYVHIYIYTHVNIYIYIYIYSCMYAYVCIYIYTCIFTYVHIYIYIYVGTCKRLCSRAYLKHSLSPTEPVIGGRWDLLSDPRHPCTHNWSLAPSWDGRSAWAKGRPGRGGDGSGGSWPTKTGTKRRHVVPSDSGLGYRQQCLAMRLHCDGEFSI